MVIYPFSTPLILNNIIFSLYGGKGTGTFSDAQLQLAFQIAEQQTVSHIGTFLLPTIVTGTYANVPTQNKRIVTDYGYVSKILNVTVKSKKVTYSGGCELVDTSGCAFIYEDTFGYIDVYKLNDVCSCSSYNYPFQYQVVYEAGLPTGTANLPGMLAGMTLAAQITLNELYPGVAGMNEGVGDVGIQEYESFGYHERRTAHSLVRSSFGGSAMANKAKQLIDSTVKKARRTLKIS